MKYIILIIFSIVIGSPAKSEVINLIFPEDFDKKSLTDYELVWCPPNKEECLRVQLVANQISVDLDFSDYRPEKIMLHKNNKFIGNLKVLGKNIFFSNVTKLTVDVTDVKHGVIYIKSFDGDGFYANLLGCKIETYDVIVDGHPIELSCVSVDNGKTYKIGMISVNGIEPCDLKIVVDKDNSGNLDAKYSYSTKYLSK